MNIYVVTGGFGFLGHHIVSEILKNDTHCRVKIIARTKDEKSSLLVDKRVEFISVDLAKEKEFAFLQNATFVIHSAALVSFSPKDKEKLFALNVQATANIARACEKYNVKRLVYVSSISAVSITGKRGIYATEDNFNDPNSPLLNLYTQSKALAEIKLHKVASHIDYVVGCPSVLLGPDDKKTESILSSLQKFPILPTTAPIWSVVDVRDCARALYFLLQHGEPQQRYIITSTHIALTELAKKFLAALRLNKSVITVPKWLVLPFKVFNPAAINSAVTDKEFSNKKLTDLGFKFTYSIDQTIENVAKTFMSKQSSL